MLAKVFGSALHGVEAFRITIEVSVANGIGYTVTGQPDEVVRESLSRAEVAIKWLGLHLEFIAGKKNLEEKIIGKSPPPSPSPEYDLDFCDVRGQDQAKRAMEIAAAGGHNILFYGPPGVGKTMLARRLPTILPPMTRAEMLETTRIHSLGGGPAPLMGLVTRRPFRNPHHTASDIALAGGGSTPQPGEISLAHNGVLFLDELYEFSRSAVEVLRQPMEEGKVRIVRARMSLEYPASFMLVAAMNPCFCGWLGHPARACTCSKRALEYYIRKTSGPLMDRIDLQVAVETVPLVELMGGRQPADSSAVIRARVMKARGMQGERLGALDGISCNARIPEQSLEEYCLLDTCARHYLFGRLDSVVVSARSYSRILKVSRTIADLAGSATVEVEHVAEAVHFRGLEKLVEGRRKGKAA